MILEHALALLKYVMVPLHTLHDFKAKDPSNIRRAKYWNQLGWDFLKWQIISACLVLSYLGTNSFLPPFPQSYISIMHENKKLFTAVMLACCGIRKAQQLWIIHVLWGSLAFTVSQFASPEVDLHYFFFHISFLIFLLWPCFTSYASLLL